MLLNALGFIFGQVSRGKSMASAAHYVTGESPMEGIKSLVTSGTTHRGTQDTTPINPRFKEHYDAHIHPKVDAFEQRRIEALTTLRKRLIIAAPLGLAALVLGASGARTPEGEFSLVKLLGTLAMIGALCAAGWAALPVLGYKGRIREEIFPEVFRFFGPSWSYDPKGIGGHIDFGALDGQGLADGIKNIHRAAYATDSKHRKHSPEADFMQSYMAYGILPGHESATTRDLLRGEHLSVPLELFQCALTSTSGTGKNRRTVTHFKGLVIQLSVPKRFSGHTVVKRDAGSVGNWFGKQFGTLPSVKLEDPRFEQRYEVYGSDQVEARYLLTTTFMERLVTLEELFVAHAGGRSCAIQCAFKDGKLLLAIPTANEWFSTGSIFKRASFIPEINLILKEMDQLFAIIDVLKLDDRTGL
jgi:hypothetical protein